MIKIQRNWINNAVATTLSAEGALAVDIVVMRITLVVDAAAIGDHAVDVFDLLIRHILEVRNDAPSDRGAKKEEADPSKGPHYFGVALGSGRNLP
jgi:hypothetical protein